MESLSILFFNLVEDSIETKLWGAPGMELAVGWPTIWHGPRAGTLPARGRQRRIAYVCGSALLVVPPVSAPVGVRAGGGRCSNPGTVFGGTFSVV